MHQGSCGFDHRRELWPLRLVLSATLALLFPGASAAGARPQTQANDTATAATGETLESHLGKGYDALKLDRFDVAVSEFRAALELDPKLVLRARFPLAVALFEQHKYDAARQEFVVVEHEVGEHPNISYYLGRLDLENRAFDSAIRNLNKAAVTPPFPDTAYYLGFAYFKAGDLAAAEKWLHEAARRNARDARIPYQLSLVYRQTGRESDARKAVELSQEIRRRDDDESQLRNECGQKLSQGSRDEALTVCEKLYDPENADKLTELGTIYGQHGELEQALKPLRRAAELAPESPQVQYNLALTYYQLNRFQDARTPLDDALKRWPDLFQVNALYGAVLSKLGDDLAAYEALRHAHRLNPQDSATGDLLFLTTLALARKRQASRQYSDALRYFSEAGTLRPVEPAPHRGMAETYTLMGRPAQAAREQQEADRLTKNLDQQQ